jgi:hypothetical protein
MGHAEAAVSDTRASPSTRTPAKRSVPTRAARPEATGAGVTAVYALFGVILVAYAVSLIVRPSGHTTTLVDGWGVASFELLSSLLVLVRAAVSPKDRRFCLALGAGMCLWAIGDIAMTFETVGGASPSTPSLANDLRAGFFPVAYVGVMLLMRQEVRKFTAANYLDGVVATLVTASVGCSCRQPGRREGRRAGARAHGTGR